MTRGPKPQPTSFKLLNGNPGKRRLNDMEPQPPAKLPDCPTHLTEHARKAWELLAPQLDECGATTKLDGVAFELLCNSYGAYLDNCEKVAKYGAVFVEQVEGSKIPHAKFSPWFKAMNLQWEQTKQMLLEFGMTPSSRSRVRRVGDPDEDKSTKFFGATG